MEKNSYLVENELIYFRRATKDDNMEEIAKLIYDTDPYIYPFWFEKDVNKCVDFLKEEMLRRVPFKKVVINNASGTICCNCGEGAFGVLFVRE